MNISAQDIDTLFRTAYGEARGESYEGIKAVAHVLLNRAERKYRGKNLHECATAKWQFSCWNENDPNRAKLLAVHYGDTRLTKCARACIEAIEEHVIGHDPTKGSLHYHVKSMPKKPAWADGETPAVTIGQHVFYNTVK